jgi:uncharacterized SAM-binding protein YcdF (DUF218 family)
MIPVRMRGGVRRAAGVLGAGAIGVSIWCFLSSLQLLIGSWSDVYGLIGFALAGLIVGGLRLERFLLILLVPLAILLVLVGSTFLSESLADDWIRDDIWSDSVVGAVVPLSAGLNPDSTISAESLDHLLEAISLIKQGKSSLLITTTTTLQFPHPGGFVSSAVDQDRIIKLAGGVPDWIRTRVTSSTRDEAVATAEMLLPRGIRTVAVVASPMHTRRACAAFEAVGFEVTCVAARLRIPGGWPSSTGPADRFTRFGAWVYEKTAMLKYQAKGWLP